MQKDSYILNERKQIWQSKKILKRLYRNWYRIIGSALTSGSILEIGAGSGNMKEFFKDSISSDAVFVPWIDSVLDAHHLPFHDATFDNIILFDVLHHLHDPAQFFCEAQKVLKRKGRIVLMEPYISLLSFLVYQFLHHEGMDWNINPFKKECSKKKRNHFQGNQAIPTLIFEKYKNRFEKDFPALKTIKKERMDFIIYPLSGGFHNHSLCPLFLYPTLEYLEKILYPLNRFLSFRLFVVLEKT